ncbi:MAG: motility protein A [Planctomycetaceae bacterium]|jgi:chemotaxis protein MotA|nr:motility protein A [Planctomycetaceae bacterium]
MGKATIIGLILGWFLMILSIALGGIEKLRIFVDVPSICIVIGGAIASVLVAYPIKSVLKTLGIIKITFTAQDQDVLETIMQIVSLSESARREGLLSLENRMEEIDNNFLATGLRMAVDGISPEVVEGIMNTEIDAVNSRHAYNQLLIANFGKYAPAFGMIGTLIGLVLMLADLDPDTIGSGMAVALLTTLYGAIISNLMLLPWADKLGFINANEIQTMEITLKGVIAIQSGENPRVIKQKLLMYLAPKDRPEDEEETN